MSTYIPGSPQLPPWEDKEQAGGLYCLEVLGVTVLILIGLMGIGLLIGGISQMTNGDQEGLWMILIGAAAIAACVVGTIFLSKPLRVPTKVVNKTPYPANMLGAPYSVRFAPLQRVSGIGTMMFTDQVIQISGVRQANTCLLFFIGWLFYSLFNEKFTRAFLYNQVIEATVTGRTLKLVFATDEPNTFQIRVATNDGERLYRELFARMPQVVSQYSQWFVDSQLAVPPVQGTAAGKQ